MKLAIVFFICSLSLSVPVIAQENDNIRCSEKGCEGTYKGPEFVDGADVAHQFSNTMSAAVGDALKACYRKGAYAKVDFFNIRMTTEGMGSGMVTYSLYVPFKRVSTACEAYTAFDHVGGWNHKPALHQRKAELSRLLMRGQALAISPLKTTPEGLQEYWIQWRHRTVQVACKAND